MVILLGRPLHIYFKIDSTILHRAQLQKYRFDRVLDTLWNEFKGFPQKFYQFAMKKYFRTFYHFHLPRQFRAAEESKTLAKNFKQPTPESITQDEFMNFSLQTEFDTMRSNCPLFYHVICGALELGEDQLEVGPEGCI